ncbi:MAG: PadR family transcriptional regulator [Candidatus Dormibacteraeota bacterium]|nr:PadR family transcriptional regulator [Candidatus Dormibacteraeota bacterium]
MRRTATTANAILGLLALRPRWASYEITKQLRRNMRFFWPRAESRIYEETKGLVAKGYARIDREHVGRRARTVYSITPAGRRALREWLASPPKGTALECEPLLRVFLSDLSTRAQLDAALEQARRDAHAILDVGRAVGPEYLAGTAPFQDQVHVRAFVFDFLSHHALMLMDWADRTEAALDAWTTRPADRVELACGVIAANLAEYPAAAD